MLVGDVEVSGRWGRNFRLRLVNMEPFDHHIVGQIVFIGRIKGLRRRSCCRLVGRGRFIGRCFWFRWFCLSQFQRHRFCRFRYWFRFSGCDIRHHLPNKRVVVQLFRVYHLAIYDAAFGQLFPQNISFRASIFFIGNLLLRPVQILPRGNQDVDALFNLGPFQTLLLPVGIRAQLDAAGIIVQKAVATILKRPAAAPGAVLLFQEFNALFLRVIFSVVGRNALFAMFKSAAGGQGRPPIRLRKRKSGDLFGLRSLVDLCDLLRLSGEKTQL